MKKVPLILEYYSTQERAERARDVLESAGLHPLILEESSDDGGAAYALQVPATEIEEAEARLLEFESSEDETSIEERVDGIDEA